MEKDLFDFDAIVDGVSPSNYNSGLSFDDFLSANGEDASDELSVLEEDKGTGGASGGLAGVSRDELTKGIGSINDDFVLGGDDKDDTVEVVPTGTMNFKEALIGLMERGVIDKYETIEIDGEDVSLEDLKEMDKETFSEIISQYVEGVKSERLDLSGVSDITKRIIELDRQGINIGQVVEAYNDSAGLVQDVDLTDTENQKRVLLHYLNEYKGYNERDAIRLLGVYEKEGSLYEEAVNAKKGIDEKFQEYTQEVERKYKEDKANFENFVKEQKEHYTASLSNLGIDKGYVKKIADFMTSYEEIDGRQFNAIDKLYSEARKDPEKISKIALFLFDEKKFYQVLGKEKEKEIVSDTFKKIRLGSSSRKEAGSVVSSDKVGGSRSRFVEI